MEARAAGPYHMPGARLEALTTVQSQHCQGQCWDRTQGALVEAQLKYIPLLRRSWSRSLQSPASNTLITQMRMQTLASLRLLVLELRALLCSVLYCTVLQCPCWSAMCIVLLLRSPLWDHAAACEALRMVPKHKPSRGASTAAPVSLGVCPCHEHTCSQRLSQPLLPP